MMREDSMRVDAPEKECLPDSNMLASPDLQAFLQRASFDSLDICQLASSPQSLFSPNGSGLELADSENQLFSKLFPGSLLFPSPTTDSSPLSAGVDGIAAPVARLPCKILDSCPMPQLGAPANKYQPVGCTTASISSGAVLTAPVAMGSQSMGMHVNVALEPHPKRRRTSVPQDLFDHIIFDEAELGLDINFPYDHGSMENTSLDSRLEMKRARNREAARRMRLRQRQTISKLEVDMGHQYNTINGLLSKLGNLADEIKSTTQENDLLKQLLASTQCTEVPADLCEVAPHCKGICADEICSPSLIQSDSLARHLPQEEYLLLKSGASPACSPIAALFSQAAASPAAAVAPAPSPVARPPRAPSSSLPPSPFESPKKSARSPSKPHTPQRSALRSPFASAHKRPSRFSLAVDSAGVSDVTQPSCPSTKAALLEEMASGGAPLQHEVLLALLHKLQAQHEMELAGAAENDITEEEAMHIAAVALLETNGNISGAVGHMLAWGGFLQNC